MAPPLQALDTVADETYLWRFTLLGSPDHTLEIRKPVKEGDAVYRQGAGTLQFLPSFKGLTRASFGFWTLLPRIEHNPSRCVLAVKITDARSGRAHTEDFCFQAVASFSAKAKGTEDAEPSIRFWVGVINRRFERMRRTLQNPVPR